MDTVTAKDFKSPARALIRSFRMSRDKWKQKYFEVKKGVKTLKVRVYDVEKSRTQWRQKAESRGAEIQQLTDEVERLRAQLAESTEQHAKKNCPSQVVPRK